MKCDIRFVAATNRDLAEEVAKGNFREDLYYRLHVVALHVPPLRERLDDIPLLCEHFLKHLAKRDSRNKALSPETLERLLSHRWPGNVRELENEIERLWVLTGTDEAIGPEYLSPAIELAYESGSKQSFAPGQSGLEGEPSGAAAESAGLTLPQAVEALERRMISAKLEEFRGNKTRASEALGISRRNLIRKVQAYGLEHVGKKPIETP